VSGEAAPGAWDAVLYQDKHSFVWRYGANLLELLNAQPGERILDVGCGTGQLTAEIARSGAHVIGLDSSADMLVNARKNFPELSFVLGDAAAFDFPEPFDAVFSNAVLHWVKNTEGAAASIARALRPGGRFVAEFGGKGNIRSIQSALRAVLGPSADEQSPWYYPSIAEYSTVLEQHGLEVRNASLFDRPTQLQGENGMDEWLRMFMQTYLRHYSSDRADEIIHQLVEHLRPALYRDGVWTVDYRRLRVVALRKCRDTGSEVREMVASLTSKGLLRR
jgi:trans-aconitate 2-methyltransferase